MFRFCDSKKDVEILKNRLDDIGLEFRSEYQDYSMRIWKFATSWSSQDEYQIVWNQQWVNDGQELEDIEVELRRGDRIIAKYGLRPNEIDTTGAPLREYITKLILERFSKEKGINT